MNKVVTINLGGTAYQLEEGGYDALRAYLEGAAARLQGNPDLDEILTDIEWAIAEKFRALLSSHKTVVVTKEVVAVLAEMGPIEAEPGKAAGADASPGAVPGASGAGATGGASGTGGAAGFGTTKEGGAANGGGTPRRLYRIREGDMIAGVCNGLAAYVGVDPTLIRLAFVFLTILWGMGVLVYIVMAIVVPEATTPDEKAAASGTPFTAQEFIRRAQAGYYEAIKGFPDRKSQREWQRRFKRDMRANADQWRQQWWHQWHWNWQGAATAPMPPGMPMPPGTGWALPFLSMLHGAMKILWICALVSLLATGEVFGKALPAGLPVWVGVLLLFFIYGSFAWPLKAGRRACYWGLGQSAPAWSLIFLVDAVIWVSVVIALLMLAVHHSPELHQAVQSFPEHFHQAVNDVATWWKKP